MNNRLISIIVISLFLMIPYSASAEEGDSDSEESKPDYIVERYGTMTLHGLTIWVNL